VSRRRSERDEHSRSPPALSRGADERSGNVILRNAISGSLLVLPRYTYPMQRRRASRVQLLPNSEYIDRQTMRLVDHDDGLRVQRNQRREKLLKRSDELEMTGLRDEAALAAVNAAARRVSLNVDSSGGVSVATEGDALDRVVAIALGAMIDGSWGRLKACRNCRWSFYDKSPNRSGTWCSMQLCGNRRKTRAYRRRKTAAR
jgi:hypothetical protein